MHHQVLSHSFIVCAFRFRATAKSVFTAFNQIFLMFKRVLGFDIKFKFTNKKKDIHDFKKKAEQRFHLDSTLKNSSSKFHILSRLSINTSFNST